MSFAFIVITLLISCDRLSQLRRCDKIVSANEMILRKIEQGDSLHLLLTEREVEIDKESKKSKNRVIRAIFDNKPLLNEYIKKFANSSKEVRAKDLIETISILQQRLDYDIDSSESALLYRAVQMKSPHFILSLIDAGADITALPNDTLLELTLILLDIGELDISRVVNRANSDGENLSHILTRIKADDELDLLIDNLDVDQPNINGEIPLTIAMKCGSYNCLDVLLKKAAIDSTDREQNTILHLAKDSQDVELILSYLQNSSINKRDFINMQNCDGDSAAHIFASRDDYESLEKVMEYLDLNLQNSFKETLLTVTVKNNSLTTTKLLLDHSAVEDVDLMALLELSSSLKIVKLLKEKIDQKEDENEKNSEGKKRETEYQLNSSGSYPWHIYVEDDNLPFTKLFEREIVKYRYNSLEQSPLHLAKSIQMVDYLISIGLDINEQDRNGDSPLHIFTRNESLQLCRHCTATYGGNYNLENNNKIRAIDIFPAIYSHSNSLFNLNSWYSRLKEGFKNIVDRSIIYLSMRDKSYTLLNNEFLLTTTLKYPTEYTLGSQSSERKLVLHPLLTINIFKYEVSDDSFKLQLYWQHILKSSGVLDTNNPISVAFDSRDIRVKYIVNYSTFLSSATLKEKRSALVELQKGMKKRSDPYVEDITKINFAKLNEAKNLSIETESIIRKVGDQFRYISTTADHLTISISSSMVEG